MIFPRIIKAAITSFAIGVSPMAIASALSASATDPIKSAADAGEYVGDHGGWAAAGVIALLAGWIVRQWLMEVRGRREDQKTMSEIITDATVSNNKSIAAEEERNKAFSASIQSQGLTVAQVTSNGLAMAALGVKMDEIAKELARTREALIAKGHIGP